LLTSLVDDVTVANFNTLKDKFGNLGAWYVLSFLCRHVILTIFSLVQDVAQKTNEVVGDGTTTTILACAIYSEGVKNVAAGYNPWIFVEVSKPPSTMSLNSSLPTLNSLPPPSKSCRSPPSPPTVTSTSPTSSHWLRKRSERRV